MSEPAVDARINTQVPHSARLWNYWLAIELKCPSGE